MIKFFRKIRYELMAKNRTGKYFKYAIGEIVLVVIGILIALQINNWNEQRKLEEVKQNYYEQLLADLEMDKSYAVAMISVLDSSITKYEEYKESLNQPYVNSKKSFNSIYKNKLATRRLVFKTSTIKSLLNTGEIGFFESDLRDKLTNYNGSKNQMLELSKGNNDSANSIYQSAFASGFLLKSLVRNQPEFADYLDIESKSPEIFIKLNGYLVWRNFGEKRTIEALKSLIESADTIIELLKKKKE